MKNITIILIGPMATGKSTVAKELAKITKLRRVPMDHVRWYYYIQDGFDVVYDESLDSFTERVEYWKEFEAKAVRKIVTEFPGSIIDFGAGHSHFPKEEHFKIAKDALAPFQNIFLLLPSESKDESLEICNQRLQERSKRELKESEVQVNKNFIFHSSNYDLAKHIVYTKDKKPQETAQEIIELLSYDKI